MANFKDAVAMRYGVRGAILLQYLWEKSQENGQFMVHEGSRWVRCPQRMLMMHFPYFKRTSVQSTLKTLLKERVIRKRKLSGCPFDHTAWYSFTEYGEKLMQEDTEK